MFFGSIPATIVQIESEHMAKWGTRLLYVGCSGNFTSERVAAGIGGFTVHSNDVTLYSAILGNYFAGTPLSLSLRPERAEQYPFLAGYTEEPDVLVATAMLLTNMTRLLVNNDGSPKQQAHYLRQFQAYAAQWPQLHAKTLETVRQSKVKLDSYLCEDVMTWVERVSPDAGVVSYPPFVGVPKHYDRNLSRLEQFFDGWEPPEFSLLTEEKLDWLYERIADRRHWMFALDRFLPAFENRLIAKVKKTNRAPTWYVYGSPETKRYVGPGYKVESFPAPHLQPGVVLGETMTLHTLDSYQFHVLRSQYMNRHIRPGMATLPVAVLVDGVLIGVFAFTMPSRLAASSRDLPQPYVYQLSDFPVRPTDYKHLAKLVLYAALSKESQLLAERMMRQRVRSVTTTAFSNNPVSMKYRGLYTLLYRKENTSFDEAWASDIPRDDPYYSTQWMLQYGAELGKWTLAEGLATWKHKHGKARVS